MVKKEVSSSQKILIKGTVLKIDEQGMHVLDGKTDNVDVIGMDLFEGFIGKEISMNICDKEVETEILTSVEEDTEVEEDNMDADDEAF